MRLMGRPCNLECDNGECPYPDCIRSGAEILHLEAVRMRENGEGRQKKDRLTGTERTYYTHVPTPEEIRRLRGDMTIKQFCEKFGVAKCTVICWEHGYKTPSPRNAAMLAEAMG